MAVIARATAAGLPVLARGLGRSYGDAAQSGGGVVVDMTGCSETIAWDAGSGRLRAQAGLSIDSLLRWSVPQGWFVPVTPGTRHVTLGGALAADVHGKNHHRDGAFVGAVESFTLLTAAGPRTVDREHDPSVFWATAGGMGLTGVVLDLALRLLPIETSSMIVETERAHDLDACMSAMTDRDEDYRYSVAWVDCLARGATLGRSVLTRGDHARLGDVEDRSDRQFGQLVRRRRDGSDAARDPLQFSPRQIASVPFTPVVSPLTALTVSAFNEAWYRRAPRSRRRTVEGISGFFHPLDAVGDWNRLYGPHGFTQYQFVVPFGAEDVVRAVIEALSRERCPAFLAVLKRFGPADEAPLSFPAEGWTLAVDLPLTVPGLGAMLDRFDERVVEAGGRVYLAKDGRVRADVFEAMYPRLGEWRSVREALDPDGLFVSDLGRRLGLVGRQQVVSGSAP
jgi:decaprenylphospho-beta-D-ribofuranose 2-oxidase